MELESHSLLSLVPRLAHGSKKITAKKKSRPLKPKGAAPPTMRIATSEQSVTAVVCSSPCALLNNKKRRYATRRLSKGYLFCLTGLVAAAEGCESEADAVAASSGA